MRRTLLLLLWILLAPQSAVGQTTYTATQNEDLRATPGGTVIANLDEGAELKLGEGGEEWQEATIEGWIWAPSVRPDQRPGFDLVVASRDGENLRVTPNGKRIARLREGALLVEIRREGRWIRVKRSGWVRSRTPATTDEKATPPQPQPTYTAGETARAGLRGARVLREPGGDTLATIRPMAEVELLQTEGEWVRVRVEGWVPTRALAQAIDTSTILVGLEPEALRANPEGFQGRIIEWEIQFIALDRAEKIRTDFSEGELFILATPPGDQPGFIYLAVPEELAERAASLTPLERVTILGRVRTGRSQQMTAPILDLLEIR